MSLTQLTLLQKRIVFLIGLGAITGFIFAINNPFEGNPKITVTTDMGEQVTLTLGIIDNVNLDKTSEGVGTDIGEAAPNFILADAFDRPLRLDSFLGEKAVVVNFWASWCFFCLQEMPDLQTISEEFQDDLVVIGINNMETPGRGASYATERGVTYPALYFPKDPDIIKAYDILSMPTTYYLDKNGIIVVRKIGIDTLEGVREKARVAIDGS